MRNKSITDILRDSRSLLSAYRQMQKDNDDYIKSVRINPDYSKPFKQRLESEANQRLANDKDRLRARLHENASEAVKLLKADNSHMAYNSITPGFYSFCQALNSPEDFESMARKCWGNPAQIFYLQGLAVKQGYRLNCGPTSSSKIKAVEAAHKLLDAGFDDDGFLDPSIFDAVTEHEKTFLSLTEADIHCTRADDLEAQIKNDLLDERRRAEEANEEADVQFLKGFGVEKVQTDLTDLPSFDAVRKAINDPKKEKAVLSKLADVLDSSKLSGTIEADDVKLSADFFRRTGDSSTADTLKAVADKMLPAGVAYQDSWGTFTQPDFDSVEKENAKVTGILSGVIQKMSAEQANKE